MGKEAMKKGVNTLLGPVVGPMFRLASGGRNWEGFAADPYLSGALAADTVAGLQSSGVMACVKVSGCLSLLRTDGAARERQRVN